MDIRRDPEWEMEAVYQPLLLARGERRKLPPYNPCSTPEIIASLNNFFSSRRPGARVDKVARMGGGASKEQFLFSLTAPDGGAQRYVLRMDPLEGITETDRRREFEVLNAVQGTVPAPKALWLDADGSHFGRPAVIMAFVEGVTKPSNSSLKLSGLGTLLGEPLRTKLRPAFMKYLVALHGLDWRKVDLPSFSVPDADPKQAARWSLNFWKQLWRLDAVEPVPIMTYAELWLADNLPDCQKLVLSHGDYRTGNYLFHEAAGEITAVLDWELARIGDFHEDLSWILMQVFGTFENSLFRASDLYTRDEFIAAYEAASGRTVNRKTLHYYDVLSSYKMYIIVAASAMSAARAQHNHQDVLMTFAGAVGPLLTYDLCRLLRPGFQP